MRVEMLLDRPLTFDAAEMNFTLTGAAGHFSDGGGPVPANKSGGVLDTGSRLPY
jgi:hypothetical protein